MAIQEEKTLLKSREKPANISGLLEFSPNKLSETEYLVMETLAKSKFAMNTYQIYRAIAEKILKETFNVKDIKDFNEKFTRALSKTPFDDLSGSTLLQLKKMWVNPKSFEKITTIVRKKLIIDIPTYPRILRTLNNLNELGWIMKREASTKKEGTFWFISDEIRKTLQP
jgi:hypothetical protein